MSKKELSVVTITRMGKRWNYFQVFILGFYELERQGKIRLRFRCEWLFRLSTLFPESHFVGGIIGKLNHRYSKDSYNMEGTVTFQGKTRRFCLDSADAPYLFDSASLSQMDEYFKMQCPNEIDPERGFHLSGDIWIPYVDHRHEDDSITKLTTRAPRRKLTNLKENLHKVKPLAIGFRRQARLNSYQALKAGYENYRKGAAACPTKKLMCYFGNALGPKPEENVTSPDWDWEADITGYFKEKVSHPNEKRAEAARIIGTLGEGYDARVISEVHADTKKAVKHEELVVPIEDFCSHISNFEYNLNISGYRMSIPNRFMESFIVGTAIVTDKLAVKWYKPFDEEVVETVEMGYLPDKEVDWEKVCRDLQTLPKIDKQTVLNRFDEKWAPAVLAGYIVEEILK